MNGDLVKEWMDRNGLRQEDFASRLGVSINTIRRILAGADDVSYPTIIAVAHVTGIPERVLGGERAKRRTA